MKHQKKNNLTPVIFALVAVMVILIVVLAILMLRDGGEEPSLSESAQLPQIETIPGEAESQPQNPITEEDLPEELLQEPEVEAIPIDTRYITLYYPGEWAPVLRVEQEEGDIHTVRFIADLESGMSVPLFDIRLGGPIEDGFAMFVAKDGAMTAISAESHDFVPAEGMRDSEIIIVYSMQEAMNEVLGGIELLYSVDEEPGSNQNDSAPQPADAVITPEEILPEDTGDDTVIDTPGGALHYPARWSEYLHVETDESEPYSVSFYCRMNGYEDQYLFTVYIGGEAGMSAGTITNLDGESTEVRIDLVEMSLDGWDGDDALIARAMQEDINYLLSELE